MGRRVVLLVLAVLIAAVGTLLVYGYVQRADDRALASQKPVQVLIAKKQVNPGTKAGVAVTSGMFVLQAVPASARVEGSLSSVADIKDQVSRTTIYPGQQIVRQLFSESASTPAQFSLSNGYTAVAFQFDDPAQVAGFVQPGNHVMVFVTTDVQGTNKTRLLLGDVQVLAVGAITSNDASRSRLTGKAGGGQQRALLTLALTQHQAAQMIFADTEGDLYLGLLGEGDKGDVAGDKGVDGRTLFK